MKTKISSIASICVLIAVVLACNASFTTANISSFNTGKNETATPPTSSFNIGEKVFAVAVVSNTSSKHKMKFKVFYENVQGKGKGEEAFSKDIEFEGSRPVFLSIDASIPGDFKVETALLDESGKEIDKKSGTFTVKGEAPTTKTETESKKDDDPETEAEDKPANN
jgi:hypothetical protein